MKRIDRIKKKIDTLLAKVFYSCYKFDKKSILVKIKPARIMGIHKKKSTTVIILKAGPGTKMVPPPKVLGVPPGRFTLRSHPEDNTAFVTSLSARMSQSRIQGASICR
jgi:hypothetical protein